MSAVGNTTGTYSWSPVSYFVDPNIQNPVFISSLSTTTVFTVVFTDLSGCIATDSVTITVNPPPTASLSVVPNPACLGEDLLLTTITSIPVNRYRFQYNIGGGWINMTNPGMSTSNPQTYYNINTNTQFRVRVREDNRLWNRSMVSSNKCTYIDSSYSTNKS